MSIEERLTALEDEVARMREGAQLPKLAKAIKEMEEAMAVVSYQHARLAAVHRSAVEWLESQNKAIIGIREAADARAKDIDARIADLVAAGRATDLRIEKLGSAVGKLISARGPQDQPHTF